MPRSRPLPAALAAAVVASVLAALAACDAARPAPTVPAAPSSRAELLSGATALLACPRSETRSTYTYVDSTGGRLDLDGNSVVIPAGAVPTRTKFTLVLPAGPHDRVDIYADDAHGYRFQKPIGVTISLRGCLLSTLQVLNTVVWYVDDDDTLLELMGGTPDPLASTIGFSTPHLSGYSVAYRSGDGSDTTGTTTP